MNVRDLITALQKIHDHNLPVVTPEMDRFVYLFSGPKIVHLRQVTAEIIESADPDDEDAFPAVSLT